MFVLFDGMEVEKIFSTYEIAKTAYSPQLFDSCVKFPLLAKTIFSIFSFLVAFSAFIMTFFMAISIDFFADKIITTFLYFNYLIFGPYMLAFSVLGIYYFDKTMYMCDKYNTNLKVLNVPSVLNLSGCMCLALVITLSMMVYQSLNKYIGSILRRSDGNVILRSALWYVILRQRESNDNNNNTNNNNNNNTNSRYNVLVNEP